MLNDDPRAVPEHPSAPLHGAEILSVSALNRLARTALERSLPLLRVSGELSNLVRAPSGHLYFTLKDARAQVRCTMWRGRAQTLPFRPENGMQVEARALVTLYEARGDFQLNVDGMRPGGAGNLFEAFIRLKEKLAAEGLFDTERKRAVPRYPTRIGVVSSPAAAALQDVIATLRRRAPHVELIVYPSAVQGDSAAASLVTMIETASARAAGDGVDVLLLVRGGGSLEDLQAFNDETLARAIHACSVPVVCGVGHESDFTIADFAADQRGATPTAVAELASAGYYEAGQRLDSFARALPRALQSRLDTLAQRLDRAALRLVHPRERIVNALENVARLRDRLVLGVTHRASRDAARVDLLALRLRSARPDLRVKAEHCTRLAERLAQVGKRLIAQRDDRLTALAAHLEHLAPDAVLARGFSITRNARGEIVRDAAGVEVGDGIHVELARGRLGATVSASER